MEKEHLLQELQFKAMRSGGAGGQHVNKVSSKIELAFDVSNSKVLSAWEKERLLQKLGNRLTKEHILLLQCEETRSQHRNKALAIDRFFDILELAFKPKKRRRKTKPSRSAIEKRLKSKKKEALKKTRRAKPAME
jgi:ribosome-associated protein